jgi:hypothetical protein
VTDRFSQIIVVRSLTSSDLGIFAAHRAAATSKQRAININSPIAAAVLSPLLFETGGTVLDCICSFADYTSRDPRHFGKVGKNWRLGGKKIEGQTFAEIDSADFALLRTPVGNDGTYPVSLAFVARAVTPDAQARLSALVGARLKQSMAVVAADDPIFGEIAALCPKPPAPNTTEIVHVAPVQPQLPAVVVPPIPPARISDQTKPRTIHEKIRSPHIMEQMLRVSSDMSAPAQLQFFDTIEILADELRKCLLKTGGIIKLEKNHPQLWANVAGRRIGFVDGGMANPSMLGAAPVAVRVGGYVVRPGDRSDKREDFITVKKLIAELYAEQDGSIYRGSFPDVGALRDAARISVEAAGGVKLLHDNPDLSWLFMHGALVNPVSRYTDVMREKQVRYRFPHFSRTALGELLPGEEDRKGREANFISVYRQQLELLQQSEAIVCGVVERESHTTSIINAVLKELDDQEIQPLLHLPSEQWKNWFRSVIDPVEEEDGKGQRITDPLLFKCVLEPGEALRPVLIDRNDRRRAPEAWAEVIVQYPKPWVSYLQPTEWNSPVRLEIFESSLGRFAETASLVYHCSLLLPRYAFPVGLDIVDKFAKIPNWMSRPVNTNTAVQALKMAMERGDTKLFDSIRRMLCGSQREFLLRPTIMR